MKVKKMKVEQKVKINSIWQDAQMNAFTVLDVKLVKDKWVIFYKNIKNQKTYSCYEEAFVSRFFEFGNHRYENLIMSALTEKIVIKKITNLIVPDKETGKNKNFFILDEKDNYFQYECVQDDDGFFK